jgi:hypothetical protein
VDVPKEEGFDALFPPQTNNIKFYNEDQVAYPHPTSYHISLILSAVEM